MFWQMNACSTTSIESTRCSSSTMPIWRAGSSRPD